MAASSRPSSFRFKFAARGWGVTPPATFTVPVLLIFASSATLRGLARSRLAPVTLMDNGAITTFATGLVRRSSAEMLASRSANSPSSNCQAGPAPGAGATAGGTAGDTVGGPGAADGLGAAAVAVAAGAGAGAGAAASLSKLTDPSGSSQLTSFTPVMLRESLCAWRGLRSTVVLLKINSGTVIQSTSEFFGRTARSVRATLETSTFRSTSSLSENL